MAIATKFPLELKNVSKLFGGVVAIADLSLELGDPGICGLIGPNGSGKTTLINMIAGTFSPTSGDITWQGRNLNRLAPHTHPGLGISRTFQQSMTFAGVTVGFNIRIAMEAANVRPSHHILGSDRIPDRLRLALRDYENTLAGRLPFGIARLLGIALAMVSEPSLLLLDEPAAGLSESDRSTLADVLLEIGNKGVSVLLVDHNMPFLMPLCSRVVVMDAGRLIADATPAIVQTDPRVIDVYLGRSNARD